MTTFRKHLRDGFALPVTIFALVAIGAIVTGGFYVSGQENRISMSTDLGEEAATVAEYGLQMVLGTWTNQDVATLASSGGTETGEAWADSRFLGSYTVSADSLGGRLYMVRIEGAATQGSRSATRLIGGLGRTTNASLPYKSALSILGPLSVEGQADIDGADVCDPTAPVAGVTSPDTTTVDMSGQGEIDGDPARDEEADMDANKLSQYGDVDLDELIASATKRYAANANPTNMTPVDKEDAAGNIICDITQNNWGDTIPGRPCSNYYPIIYGEGNLTLNGSGGGGQGQGILIVEGNATIEGNIKFKGVVIVKGDLSYAGNGGHVEGAMIVMGSGSSTSAGSSMVEYNHCIVDDVFNGGLRMRPLTTRSWVDLGALVAKPT